MGFLFDFQHYGKSMSVSCSHSVYRERERGQCLLAAPIFILKGEVNVSMLAAVIQPRERVFITPLKHKKLAHIKIEEVVC